MIHNSPKAPPIMADQLTDALSGHVVLSYRPPDLGGVYLVYEDGRLLRFFVSADGELAVHFSRVRGEA